MVCFFFYCALLRREILVFEDCLVYQDLRAKASKDLWYFQLSDSISDFFHS